MNEAAIRICGISKKYRIGRHRAYKTVYEQLAALPRFSAQVARRLVRRSEAVSPPAANEIWALKDVTFDVQRGEVVGIIGRNGAGKSTLLKILSRITKPTEGYAEIHGRVGSLLEVGTGFHPELTGRENIYLNGTILGMKRREIEHKFDEIVEFAEVEKFIDTPVKHFSTGMYVRLAFAVAAHLEPEFLLIDEVLAVGDAAFQKKCLGKMSEVASEGRTILFVSHSMPAIQSLCRNAVVLSSGRVGFCGPVEQAVQSYLASNDVQEGVVDLTAIKHRMGTGEVRLQRFWIEDEEGVRGAAVPSGSRCSLVVEYVTMDGETRRDVSMSFHINTITGAPVSLINTNMLNQNFRLFPPRGRIRLEIPRLPLTAGRYAVDLNIATYGGYTYSDFIRSAAAFEVTEGDFYGTGRPGNPGAPVMIEAGFTLDEAPREETEKAGANTGSE